MPFLPQPSHFIRARDRHQGCALGGWPRPHLVGLDLIPQPSASQLTALPLIPQAPLNSKN
ncbi:hypothetical protein EXN66_Car018224 [Channa argus]|uniref:Uncharacterized protein n=1 Tax=Channa argus TaxID=215402 RepID=A0A6G1QKB3_CHAAH|nr:hypothetical protein EXN66_Car018224 [Channa argus]